MTNELDELLTIAEAAAALRMSKTTFRRRLSRGEFAVVRDRRVVLVPRAALVEYLDRHTAKAREHSRLARVTRPHVDLVVPRPSGGRVRRLWDAEDAG
jgi:excisionase family DNA binding protein